MMTPRWPSSSTTSCVDMASAARRSTLNVPTRFTETADWNRSRSWTPFLETIRAAGAMPAQLTTTRSGAASVALAIAALTSSSLVTSAATSVIPVSIPCSTALSMDCWRSRPNTVAPFSASDRAVALPRPEAAPVTMTEAPLMSTGDVLSSGDEHGCARGMTPPVSQSDDQRSAKAALRRGGRPPETSDGPRAECAGAVGGVRGAGGSALGGGVPLGDVLPVDDVPPCLDVVRLDVLVLQVEGVLPHVQHEQGRDVDRDVALLIGELLDDEALADVVPAQHGPARALQGRGDGVEVRLELVEGAELGVDRGRELALGLPTTVWRHVLPEHRVVGVAAEVEREVLAQQRGLAGDGAVVAGLGHLLERGVGGRGVGVVVLGVVPLHDLAGDVRLQRAVVIVEIGKNVLSHNESSQLGGGLHAGEGPWRPSRRPCPTIVILDRRR